MSDATLMRAFAEQIVKIADNCRAGTESETMAAAYSAIMSVFELAASPAPPAAPEGLGWTEALQIANAGYVEWASKPHNKKWASKIQGTPIPNDLCVAIAEQFVRRQRAQSGEG